MCLAQGHNTVIPVRLEPATPQPRVKHYTTEPLCSLSTKMYVVDTQKSRLNETFLSTQNVC